VVLLGGWLLMIAPLPDRPGPLLYRFDAKSADNVPIKRWRQLAAYDTAAACERVRTATPFSFNEADGSPMPVTQDQLEQFRGRYLRCVPTEAVYPQQTPAQK